MQIFMSICFLLLLEGISDNLLECLENINFDVNYSLFEPIG